MRIMKWMWVLVAGLVISQGMALAEMVQGQVTAINPEDRSLTVQRLEDAGQAKEISLSVPENAELRGIQAFEDVEVGDEIRAEANKPALGIGSWEAKWIEKAEGAAAGNQINANDRNRNAQQGSSMQASTRNAGSTSSNAAGTSVGSQASSGSAGQDAGDTGSQRY